MAVLHKLDTTLSEIYKFEDKESGLGMLDTMGSTVSVLIDEMKNLSEEFGAGEDFNEKCSVIKDIIEQYI